MSNSYGLLIASTASAKKFCKQVDIWELRCVRADWNRKHDANDLALESINGCLFSLWYVEPGSVFDLLRLFRGETEDDVPYYSGTYSYEKYMSERFWEEMPYVYGGNESSGPWLTQVPVDVVKGLAELETKSNSWIWRATVYNIPARSCSVFGGNFTREGSRC